MHSHLNPLPEFPALTHVHEAHCSATHWLPQHIHETFEIVYVASGRGQWNFEEQDYALRPGDLYLIQPGELHGGRADPNDPYITFIVGFDPAALPLSQTTTSTLPASAPAPTQPEAPLTRWNNGVLVMNAPMRDLSQAAEQVRVLDEALGAKSQRVLHGAHGAQEIFRRLLAELDRPDETPAARTLKVLMVQALLVELLVYIARLRFEQPNDSMLSAATPVKRSDIQEVVKWLQDRVCQPPSLPEMAARAGLSPAHFSVIFKLETGLTPLEWMTKLRIDEAARWLREKPGSNITEVALELGFSSSQYFSLVFRKHKGCTPGEWRSSRKNS